MLVWFLLRPEQFLYVFDKNNWFVSTIDIIKSTFAINIFLDFFSLVETRWMIDLAKAQRCRASFIILVDVILTFIIAIFWIAIVVIFYLSYYFFIEGLSLHEVLIENFSETFPKFIWPPIYAMLTLSIAPDQLTPSVSPGVFFYSTFFSSVWLWLYILSSRMLRSIEIVDSGFHRLKKLFDIDGKPLKSMGYMSMIFVTVFLLILSSIFKLATIFN